MITFIMRRSLSVTPQRAAHNEGYHPPDLLILMCFL
jgi:hypothetical protein